MIKILSVKDDTDTTNGFSDPKMIHHLLIENSIELTVLVEVEGEEKILTATDLISKEVMISNEFYIVGT